MRLPLVARVLVVAVLAGGVVFLASNRGFSGGSGDPPTFYADVLPVLQANCQSCHMPDGLNLGGMVAPMSFMTYEETAPWAPLIADAVESGRMPPWHADPVHNGTFINERVLSDDDRATLVAWARSGAPAGDPPSRPSSTAPEIAVSPGGWHIGEPDLVIQMPEPYLVADEVNDQYVDIPIRITEEQLPEPRWVKAIEFRPGSKAVHHIIAGILGGIAPGVQPTIYRDGYGVLLPKGPIEVVFQMHYHKQPGPGTAVLDQSSAGIVFYEPGQVIKNAIETEPLGMFDFVIPPGDPNYSASTEFTFQRDEYIHSLTPHMHLRGKSAKYELTYPDGRQHLLLHVPRYDFNWQHTYEFAEPVFAPAGSKLRLTLTWDNSADNPHNPDPTIPVRWGEPTTAEMGYGFMSVTSAEPLNIVVGDPVPPVPPGGYRRSLAPPGFEEQAGGHTGH